MVNMDSWKGSNDHDTLTWTVIYLVTASGLDRKLEVLKTIQSFGKIFFSDGNVSTADTLFTVALGGFTKMDVHRSRADCFLCLGDIARTRGELSRASTLWKHAKDLFARSLQAKDVSKIDSRLIEITHHREESLVQLAQLNVPIGLLEELVIATGPTHRLEEIWGEV
jgi:hypothetical protein